MASTPARIVAAVRARLACALGRRDEVPNQELAADLARRRDRAAIAALTLLLITGTKAERSDAIKVLYEIGGRDARLIAPHGAVFAELLESREGRLVWGAMIALDTIASVDLDVCARILPRIVATARGNSVIARDHAVAILARLAGTERHRRRAWPLLLAQLRTSPDLQFPSYCERAAAVARGTGKAALRRIVAERLPVLPRPSQQRRVVKVLARLAPVA